MSRHTHKIQRAGEMTEQIRAQAVLIEDLGSNQSTYIEAYSFCKSRSII